MAFDYRDGYGNCPPGYYRPAPMYDCRPSQSPVVIQQENLRRASAYYVDTGEADASQQVQRTQQHAPDYYAPTVQAPPAYAPASSGGGLDLTTLLILGAVLFFVMKK